MRSASLVLFALALCTLSLAAEPPPSPTTGVPPVGGPRPHPATKPVDAKAPKRLVFLVSCAAGMINDYPRAANFVSDRVWELDPKQQFVLIVYGGNDVKRLNEKGFVPATDANKSKSDEF